MVCQAAGVSHAVVETGASGSPSARARAPQLQQPVQHGEHGGAGGERNARHVAAAGRHHPARRGAASASASRSRPVQACRAGAGGRRCTQLRVQALRRGARSPPCLQTRAEAACFQRHPKPTNGAPAPASAQAAEQHKCTGDRHGAPRRCGGCRSSGTVRVAGGTGPGRAPQLALAHGGLERLRIWRGGGGQAGARRSWPWRTAAWNSCAALSCSSSTPERDSASITTLYTPTSGRCPCACISSSAWPRARAASISVHTASLRVHTSATAQIAAPASAVGWPDSSMRLTGMRSGVRRRQGTPRCFIIRPMGATAQHDRRWWPAQLASYPVHRERTLTVSCALQDTRGTLRSSKAPPAHR